MNDTVVLVGIGVVIAAFVWFFIFREDESEKKDPFVSEPKPDPVVNRAPGGRASEGPIPAEAKTPNKLPTAKTMESMTKAKLEELGREHGVELDKRKTKANMITDLKAGVKAK